jgi:hypothetical protein
VARYAHPGSSEPPTSPAALESEFLIVYSRLGPANRSRAADRRRAQVQERRGSRGRYHALTGLLPAGNVAVAQPAGSSIFRLRRNAGTSFASASLSQMSGPLAGPQTNPSVSLSFGVDHD